MTSEQSHKRSEIVVRLTRSHVRAIVLLPLLALLVFMDAGCSRLKRQKQGVRPRTLRDVPANRLAFQFAADTEAPPGAVASDDSNALLPAIQSDFTTRRPDDALIRTVASPDKQRVLVIYATGGDQPNEYRIDLYGSAGDFQRNVTPPGLAVVFAPVASWSPDGNYMAFIAYKSSTPEPAPTPDEVIPDVMPAIPSISPSPLPSTGPKVQMFSTEQIYICSRDGFDLKPLTTRDGLVYFFLAWAPDSHALASLACKSDEWRDRPLLPAGRPRLIDLEGTERLLDDSLTDVLPVWSTDASKVASAVEVEVRIYDALTATPTQAAIPLKEALLTASRAYDEKERAKHKQINENSSDVTAIPGDEPPQSFNPIVALEWPKPETLYLQTGYVRNYENDQRRTWMRWHLLTLSAQAALLK